MLDTPKFALKPMQIGNITIDTPITLAPMAGHTNYALRTLVRELGGCGLVCTELISSNVVHNSRNRAIPRFDWRDHEKPFAVQLFGSDPDIVAESAQVVVDYGADIVDINMGCWVPKDRQEGWGRCTVARCRYGDGCCAKRWLKVVDVPVTVKVRSGFEDGVVTAIPFAKAAEQVGAKAVAVHARFAKQGHTW